MLAVLALSAARLATGEKQSLFLDLELPFLHYFEAPESPRVMLPAVCQAGRRRVLSGTSSWQMCCWHCLMRAHIWEH